MQAKFSLVYNRRKKKNKDGHALLEYSITIGGKRKIISTGYTLKPEQWNDKKKRVTGKHPYYLQINAHLNQQLQKLETAYHKAIANERSFSVDDALMILRGRITSEKFLTFANNIHEQEKNELAEGTLRHQRSAIDSFYNFAGDIHIKDITQELIYEYSYYLRRRNLSQPTQYNKHKFLKKILNIAYKRGLIEKNPYSLIKLERGGPPDRNGLEFSEIEKIENLDLSADDLIRVRDMFIFQCYTGLRFSDLQNLTHDNIAYEGESIILYFIMEKTKRYKNNSIVLHLSKLFEGKPAEIITPYLNTPSHYIFPRMSNQHANRQLKIIQQITGIKQPLSTHIARHTFCSRLAEIHPDPYLIKELAGHSDIRTSMIYIHQSKTALGKKLDNITWNKNRK